MGNITQHDRSFDLILTFDPIFTRCIVGVLWWHIFKNVLTIGAFTLDVNSTLNENLGGILGDT